MQDIVQIVKRPVGPSPAGQPGVGRWMVEWMYACMNMGINLYLSYLPHDLPP